MKPNDNIEDFFQRRLAQDAISPSDWNTPSDDLWEAAKAQFPEKKKKRRIAWWWFFPVALGLVFLITQLPLNRTSETVASADQAINNSSINQSKNETEKTDEKSTIIPEEPKFTAPASTTRSQHKTEIPKNKINQTDRQSTYQSLPVEQDPVPLAAASSQHYSEISKERTAQTTLDFSNKIEENKKSSTHQSPTAMQAQLREAEASNASPTDVDKVKDEHAAQMVSAKNENAISSLVERRQYNYQALSSLMLSEFPLETPKLAYDGLVVEKKKAKLKYWEVGLSHSQFDVNPAQAANDDGGISSNETYRLFTRYTNVNAIVRRHFHPRWSIASGLYYSGLQINFRFTAIGPYEPQDAFKVRLDENLQVGSLSLNGDNTEVFLPFKSDADLNYGDELLLEGLIPIKLKALQIPARVQYDIPWRRWNVALRGAATLDIFKMNIDYLEMAIYNGTTLVTDPVEYNAISSVDVGVSFYAGGGLEYRLSDRWQLSLATNIDLLDTVFTRHELGLYYRW